MADKIQQEIENISKSIDNLTAKIEKLQAQMKSGDFGTGQLAAMQAQLDKLNASLAGKQVRKEGLISKQEVQNIENSQRALESLNKSIDKVNSRLTELYSQRRFGRSNRPGAAEEVEKEIAKYERALHSFESRKYSQFSPITGARKSQAEKDLEATKIQVDLEERLSKIAAAPNIQNVNLEQRLGQLPLNEERVLQNAREIAKAYLDQIKNLERASALDEKRLQDAEFLKAATTGQTPIQRAQNVLETGGHQPGEPVYTPQSNTSSYNALFQTKAFKDIEDRVNAEQNKILKAKIKEVDAEEKRYIQAEKAGLKEGESDQKAFQAINKKAKAEERAAAAAEKEAIQKKQIADAQTLIANNPRYRQALEQAGKLGLGAGDLQKIEERGGGVQQLLFKQQRGGVDYNYRTYVNEAGQATAGLSSQFRTFGRDVIRDIGQFTKWSIAIAAVYTPMQKLGELITVMIDNESRLADATIAANEPFSKAGQIFDTVSTSADKMGESINTTIDAYTQAIRAAGRYTDEATKQAAAQKLLNDSLILSKLSSLDQTQSIDTLSAALLQSDRSLAQGTELLNKWVRVQQIANVGLDSLATGVAVLGDSAETAGLDVDHLNGLIAVLSEQSISGAKEAANTAKALVGAYQSDKAEATLNRYGIALRKTNGEVRGFLEIYQELARLRQQGVLSEAAIGEVALALGGGGVRRAKDASALINSTDRLNKIAEESAKITGQDTLAQEALSKKLETVQTANTKLANSFQELAQTLGDKGGLLDLFKFLINSLTLSTKGITELFGILGRSGPILTTFIGGLIALQSMSTGRKDIMLASLGAQGGGFKGFLGGTAQYGQTIGGGPLADILRMNKTGGAIIGGLGIALQAGSNLQAGRNENALANIGGGVLGGLIGTLVSPGFGTAVGANIGSAAGDALVTVVGKHSTELADYFLPKVAAGYKAPQPTATDLRGKTTQELIDTAYNSLNIFQKLQVMFQGQARFQPGATGLFYQNKESAAMDALKNINPALYEELQRQLKEQERQLRATKITETYGTGAEFEGKRRQLEAQATQARQYQLTQLAQGKITSAEFGRISGQLAGFPSASIKSVEKFGDEMFKVSKDIKNSKEAYDAFLYIAQYGTQDQINLISSYSDDIIKLQDLLKNWKPEDKNVKLNLSFGEITFPNQKAVASKILEEQTQGATAIATTLQQIQTQQAQAVKLPPLIGDYNKPLTGRSQDIIVQRGLAIQEKYLVETGKTTEEIARFKSGIEAFYTTVNRGSGAQFEAVNGLTQQFYDLGKAAAEAAGELDSIQPIGFQKFDVPMSQLNMLAQQSLAIGGNWQKRFNYDFKPEDQIAIDNQGIVQPLHADFKILALLLEKLNEKAQKQLDGQYNIPEGATFWVPLTAAYYRNQGGTGNDINNMLNGLDLQGNTTATDQNTSAVNQLTEAMLQRKSEEAGYGTPRDYFRAATKEAILNRKSEEAGYGIASRFVTPGANTLFRKSEEAGYGTPYAQHPGPREQGILDDLKNFFSGIFSDKGLFTQRFNPLTPSGRGAFNSGQTPQVNTSPTTKLDLRLSSNINLVVDGRILASTLQSYLASELLRTEQSQGTITKRYVI